MIKAIGMSLKYKLSSFFKHFSIEEESIPCSKINTDFVAEFWARFDRFQMPMLDQIWPFLGQKSIFFGGGEEVKLLVPPYQGTNVAPRDT